jgi:hypothetical protein
LDPPLFCGYHLFLGEDKYTRLLRHPMKNTVTSVSPAVSRIVIGLGNPSDMFSGTPHSIGHAVGDAIVGLCGVPSSDIHKTHSSSTVMSWRPFKQRKSDRQSSEPTWVVPPRYNFHGEWVDRMLLGFGTAPLQRVGLLKPGLPMNLNGTSAGLAIQHHRRDVQPAHILIVHDDFNLPLGREFNA